MAVTIHDVLELDIMKGFKVVAGEGGLTETINSTEILDFEFLQEGVAYRKEKIFEGDSIVLSSLLFAKDRPELVLDSVKRLMDLNVKGLAYKPVFFHSLPKEALAYADQNNFVILEFGYDEFFEDVISSIKELVEKDQAADLMETLFEEMLERKFSAEEAEAAKDKINPLPRGRTITPISYGTRWASFWRRIANFLRACARRRRTVCPNPSASARLSREAVQIRDCPARSLWENARIS